MTNFSPGLGNGSRVAMVYGAPLFKQRRWEPLDGSFTLPIGSQLPLSRRPSLPSGVVQLGYAGATLQTVLPSWEGLLPSGHTILKLLWMIFPSSRRKPGKHMVPKLPSSPWTSGCTLSLSSAISIVLKAKLLPRSLWSARLCFSLNFVLTELTPSLHLRLPQRVPILPLFANCCFNCPCQDQQLTLCFTLCLLVLLLPHMCSPSSTLMERQLGQ